MKNKTVIKIFQESLRALKEATLYFGFPEQFTEWEKQNPNYKEILEDYKATPAKEQGRSL